VQKKPVQLVLCKSLAARAAKATKQGCYNPVYQNGVTFSLKKGGLYLAQAVSYTCPRKL